MEYEIVKSQVNKENILLYSQFLTSSFLALNYTDISRASVDYLQWQYIDNPNGQFIGYDAFYNGELVSHWATLPILYNIKGKSTKGLLALNLVTHPKHRMKGLFIKIANRTFEEAFNLGYEFIIGVANQNSTHGLVNKLGFDLISRLDVKIGSGIVDVGKRENHEFYSLWNKETLKWRLSNPFITYFNNKRNDIIASTGKFKIYAQMHYNQTNSPEVTFLKNKNSLLNLWIGLSKDRKTKGMLIDLPEKFRPVPLNLIFKNLKDNDYKFTKDDVFFELIDFDAY